jgi:pSer/pThr/pTyr-binding forkhead associated (FHA) protein
VEYVEKAPPEWEGRDYHIDYERAAARSARKPRSTKVEVPSTEFAVMRGGTSRRKYTFTAARINIGRLIEVRDRDDKVLRENHVDFADSDQTPNSTVSRAHAHIVFDEEKNAFRIHDDGSSHGTSIVRRGATIEVPRSGSRGVALRDGDELLIGSARLRFHVK